MIFINTVTAICFGLLIGYVVYLCVKFIQKDRAERINFLRNFKKGNCLTIFLIALPLVFLGYWYVGHDIILALFDTIPHVFNFVVLKYDVTKLSALTDANLFYKITIYFCCVLVTINAVLFALSVFSQKTWKWIQKKKAKLSRRDALYIFGHNPNNLSIYQSETKQLKYIVDKISDSEQTSLYSKKIKFIDVIAFEKTVSEIFDLALKANAKSKSKANYTIVINFEDDTKNLEVIQLFVQRIEKLDEAVKEQLFNQFCIYVFGEPVCESIYQDVVREVGGCIQYKNKYKMLANKFVDEYPLSKFMNSNHINYDNCCIKDGVSINMCLVGFGKINQQILMTSVANNQFIALSENSLINKKVNYHIFDKGNPKNNLNLNHAYFRYGIEFKGKKETDYLPLPEDPAIENFYKMDINEPDFFNQLKIITKNPNDINYIVVSFGNDLENIDLAQKLIEKRREWELENLFIFVRVKKNSSGYSIFDEINVFALGDEDDNAIYNIDEIVCDSITKMALMRNEIYDLEYKITTDKNFEVNINTDSVMKNNIDSRKKWFVNIHPIQRESNIYCCLCLRLKLNLLGLDYCKNDENDLPALTEQEFMDVYAKDDLPNIQFYNKKINDKNIIYYDLNFKDSKRKNLAVLEHQRWNSFMISKGLVPASKKQILEDKIKNGKDYSLRRHGNLTTFQGLIEFRKMVAKRDHRDEIDCDVIKYDYQILDDAFWLLNSNGYKIVKK